MKPLAIAVVGAGHLGRIHVRILSGMKGVSLVGVVDPLESQRDQVAREFGTRAFADVRELAGQIDAAVVCTPTCFHRDVALEILGQGVHLLVEKPLAATKAEADEMVEAARRQGLVLQVGHVERFNPAFNAALPYLREPKYIEATRRSAHTFRSTDIGVVLDLMIHDIDLVLSLVRSDVREIEALGISLFGRHEDVANARLVFENGCVATLNASRASQSVARTMQVWTPQAFAAIDFAARTASVIRPSDALLHREVDVERMTSAERLALKDRVFVEHLPLATLPVPTTDAITAELLDFTESIRTGRSPRVPGEQGQQAMEVAERILGRLGSHAWNGTPDGPVGPLAVPGPNIIRGPHWHVSTPVTRREAS